MKCWFKPGCKGVPVFPGGMCAKCDARTEKRAATISYKTRRKLDRAQARYVKLRGKEKP